MSKSGKKESDKSPIKDKVAVASRLRGVFMETSDFEAETGIKLSSEVEEILPVTQEVDTPKELPDDTDDKEPNVEDSMESKPFRKKVHPRSKKRRFTKKASSKSQSSLHEHLEDSSDRTGLDIKVELKDSASEIQLDTAMETDDLNTEVVKDGSTALQSRVNEKDQNILRENQGGEIEIASHASLKCDEALQSLSEESLNVVSSSCPSDVDAEVEKLEDGNKETKKSKEGRDEDENNEEESKKIDEPSVESPIVTRRSKRQEKKKEAEKEKEIKVESADEYSNDATETGRGLENLLSLGSRREYLDAEENMDDSASANDRFEVDSVDGSELEDIDSVDSGSTITRRVGAGAIKRKGKKPNRKTASRKGSAKGGKGGKSKGGIGAGCKGKSRRAIFKKSATKAPAAVATAMTSNRIYYKGQYYSKGDIVSVVDLDGGVFYAQLKGFLTDQYCEKSGIITWLLPTTQSPSPESGFDPATYVIGPEEDLPRKLDYFTFVMHAPDDYFYYKNAPYPTNNVIADQEFVMTRMGPKVRLKAPTDSDINSIPFREESYYFANS